MQVVIGDTVCSTLAGSGSGAVAEAARARMRPSFNAPRGVAALSGATAFVADTGSSVLRMLSLWGVGAGSNSSMRRQQQTAL